MSKKLSDIPTQWGKREKFEKGMALIKESLNSSHITSFHDTIRDNETREIIKIDIRIIKPPLRTNPHDCC